MNDTKRKLPNYYIGGVGTKTFFTRNINPKEVYRIIDEDGVTMDIYIENISDDRTSMDYQVIGVWDDCETSAIGVWDDCETSASEVMNDWSFLATMGVTYQSNSEIMNKLVVRKTPVYFHKPFFEKHKDEIVIIDYRETDDDKWQRYGGYVRMCNDHRIRICIDPNDDNPTKGSMYLSIPLNEDNLRIITLENIDQFINEDNENGND